jgi:hypothetical protein
MKRDKAKETLEDEAFQTLRAEFRNILIVGLAADRPDRADIRAKFDRAVAINLEALTMGLRALADNSDLES